MLDYYKQQNNQLQRQNEEYLLKISHLTENNKQLQKELARYASDNTTEMKVIELQNRAN